MAASDYPLLDPDAARHIDLFIASFVRPAKQPRWRSVLSMKPAKWAGASAYDCSVPEENKLWQLITDDADARHPIVAALDKPAWIFPVGHSAYDPAFRSTLREAIFGDDSPSEFVASIEPGKLAVAFGHADEIRLCLG